MSENVYANEEGEYDYSCTNIILERFDPYGFISFVSTKAPTSITPVNLPYYKVTTASYVVCTDRLGKKLSFFQP